MCLVPGPGIAEGDENCKKFMERTMPDCFNKVWAHGEGVAVVHRKVVVGVVAWPVANGEWKMGSCEIDQFLVHACILAWTSGVFLFDLRMVSVFT